MNHEARIRGLLAGARYRSKLAGVPFNLEPADVIVPPTCPVLGIELRWTHWNGPAKTDHHTPSLDRIVSALGYVRGNVNVISLRANRLRNDATADELEAVARYARNLTR